MTAPFQPNFPTHFSSPPVVFDPGIGGPIANGLAGVLTAMQEREKLNREQAEFESKQAYFSTLNEGNKLDNKKKQEEFKAKQAEFRAKSEGLDAYTQWVGGGAKKDAVGGIVARIKDPTVAQDFIDRMTTHWKSENEAAIAQNNRVQADVAAATQQEEIDTKKSQSKTAANQATITGEQAKTVGAQEAAQTALLKAQAAKAIADANAPPTSDDPSNRINSAMNLWKTGTVDMEGAMKSVGLPVPPGTDPKAKFDPTLAGQSRGMMIYKAQAKQSAAQVLQANTELDAMIAKGIKLSPKSMAFNKVPFGAAQGLIPEDQQQMMSAAATVLSQYTLAISGKAATEAEVKRLMGQIAPIANDKEGTIKRKQIRREAIIQVMFDAAQGANRPLSDIFKDVIGAMKAKGVGPEDIRLLEEDRQKAFKMEQNHLKKAEEGDESFLPITSGLEPATPDSVGNLLGRIGY